MQHNIKQCFSSKNSAKSKDFLIKNQIMIPLVDDVATDSCWTNSLIPVQVHNLSQKKILYCNLVALSCYDDSNQVTSFYVLLSSLSRWFHWQKVRESLHIPELWKRMSVLLQMQRSIVQYISWMYSRYKYFHNFSYYFCMMFKERKCFQSTNNNMTTTNCVSFQRFECVFIITAAERHI